MVNAFCSRGTRGCYTLPLVSRKILDKESIMEKKIDFEGLFIVFEGCDGSGKTTHCRLLRDYLNYCGTEVVITREPGGSPVAEGIRQVLEYVEDDETAVYLMQASRIENVKNTILPALNRGAVVICDRFVDSMTAYQGYAGKQDLKLIEILNDGILDRIVPDIIFYLYSDERKPDRKNSELSRFEKPEFQKAVKKGYKETLLGREEVFSINSDGDILETQLEIRRKLNNFFLP